MTRDPLDPDQVLAGPAGATPQRAGPPDDDVPHPASTVQEPPAAPAQSGVQLLTLEDLAALPSPRWLIDGVLPAGVLALLHAEAGAGKTFVAVSMGLAVAADVPWHGETVDGGPVVWLAAEAAYDVADRAAAWQALHPDADPSGFLTVPGGVALNSDQQVAELLAALRPVQPALIVVDTLALSIPGSDENSAADIGEVLGRIRWLIAETGATVLLVHHDGHNNAGRARGSSALPGAVDTRLSVSKPSHGVHRLTCKKQRSAPEFAPITFRLVEAGGESAHGVPRVALQRDDSSSDGWRPTVLMERVSRALEQHVELTTRQLREHVSGRREYVKQAADQLVAEGYVEIVSGPRGGQVHRVVAPFRDEAADAAGGAL